MVEPSEVGTLFVCATAVPPQDNATDEMGHLWIQVLPLGEKDQRMDLQEAIMQRRLEKYPADFSAHFNLGALLLTRGNAAA